MKTTIKSAIARSVEVLHVIRSRLPASCITVSLHEGAPLPGSQDQEQIKFSEEFKDTMKAVKKFIEVSNQHTPYLLCS